MAKSRKKILPKDPFHLIGRWAFSLFSFVVFRTYSRVIIRDRNLLPKGPFIICSNHQSHLDALILAHVGTYNFSKSAMIAAKDYWYDDNRRFYLSRLFFNIIPINRKTDATDDFNFRQVNRISTDFLNSGGRCVVILPEGTRSKDGKIKAFKKGINMMAQATELPVVPAYIKDSRYIWPKGSFYMRPGKIVVQVGEPINPAELKASEDPDLIKNCVVELSKVT